MKELLNQSFILGIVVAMSFQSLTMDILGKDEYIKHVSENWIQVPIIVWIVILVGSIAAFIYIKRIKK